MYIYFWPRDDKASIVKFFVRFGFINAVLNILFATCWICIYNFTVISEPTLKVWILALSIETLVYIPDLLLQIWSINSVLRNEKN
jgi:hypothetical protein